MNKKVIVFLLSLSVISSSFAESKKFSSADVRVTLVELYTSEGCSSCPPADRWLSKFKHDERLWKSFIPIAFHVDYWDNIGWPDRFASASYSDRQRRYAQSKNINTIYTPGVLLNGEEWRAWYYKRPLKLDKQQAGRLSVELNGDQLSANYQSEKNLVQAYLNIAILGFDLKTMVKAGENSGRDLQHDFVVLAYKRLPMNADQSATSTLLPEQVESAKKTGLAVWIDEAGNLSPVQATGGWL